MELLLDTHVFLWWDSSDPRLSTAVGAVISNPKNLVFVSAATIWEIAIKRAKGKLVYSGSPTKAILTNGFLPLNIEPAHAETAAYLEWSHSDPFDRMLVAQAQSCNLTLIHADIVIAEYKSISMLWAN